MRSNDPVSLFIPVVARSATPRQRKGLRAVVASLLGSAVIVALGACGSSASQPTSSATQQQSAIPPSAAPTTTPSPSAVPAASDPASVIPGTWSGSYENTSPAGGGDFTLQWQLQGGNLTGTITITGTPCVSSGSITGTVSGNTITFGAVQAGQSIMYQGAIAGTTMSGTYSAPSCGGAKGTWTAHKT